MEEPATPVAAPAAADPAKPAATAGDAAKPKEEEKLTGSAQWEKEQEEKRLGQEKDKAD